MKLECLPTFAEDDESCVDFVVTPETQNNILLLAQKTNLRVREIGQLRRAKMHICCLIDDLNIKSALTPALRELLEASLTLQTTSTKVLANYLKRSPATIRTEFLKILSILGERGSHFSV